MRDSNGSNGSNGNNPNTKAVRRCMILPFRVCVVTVAMIVCHHVPGVLSLSVSPSSSSSSQQPQKQQKEWVPQDEVLPQEYYAQVYDDDDERRIPWNVGGPQPAVVSAAKDGKFQRGQTVLDCGCGMGENSIFLAEKKGCVVTGFDLSEEAVNKARQRSSVALFEVASCLDLSSSALAGQTFDVALDSACLHCFSDEDAVRYVRDLAPFVTDRIFVGCFSTANPPENWTNPRRISREDLHRYFCPENGWEVVGSIQDKWWARPDHRGSNQGSFCQALWMEAKRV